MFFTEVLLTEITSSMLQILLVGIVGMKSKG